MNPSTGVIRTPDQRLRVFVSSTLKELAPERRAARVAVERLHLVPVFELGARPHPPRDLYRAYLEQSDVFVGLYWEAYGWVAPTETVSGLEDEYNLATLLPKLICFKEPRGARDLRLVELLDRTESLRKQTGLYNATSFSFHQHYLAPILAGDDASDLETARTEGRDMSMEDVVEFALAGRVP